VTVGGAGPGGRHRGLEADYAEALDGYLGAPDERGLAAAYELGHRAVEAGVGLLELVGIHHRAVERVAPDLATRARLGDAAAFLAESLSTYEMAQRGYREARERALWLHQLALTLQRSLLPEVRATDGLEVAVRYLPAGPEVEVGGDWYDVVHLGEGRVALVVGDVMGHGIQQAAVMGQVRMGLRAYLLEGHPVDEVVRRSDALLATMADAQTATLVLGVVTLGAATMTLANAGHPPALLVDPDGRARFVGGAQRPAARSPRRGHLAGRRPGAARGRHVRAALHRRPAGGGRAGRRGRTGHAPRGRGRPHRAARRALRPRDRGPRGRVLPAGRRLPARLPVRPSPG